MLLADCVALASPSRSHLKRLSNVPGCSFCWKPQVGHMRICKETKWFHILYKGEKIHLPTTKYKKRIARALLQVVSTISHHFKILYFTEKASKVFSMKEWYRIGFGSDLSTLARLLNNLRGKKSMNMYRMHLLKLSKLLFTQHISKETMWYRVQELY